MSDVFTKAKLSAVMSLKVAHNGWMMGTYYQASAPSDLGRVDWACHASSPTSMVYANEARKTRVFIAWNPSARAQTVRFFEGTRLLGQLEIQPHSIATASSLKQ